ncbi:MAG: GNAT superfamily N-acetyltransferase [Myxococcota bacterium]|jgi:GNAT superfamily N-acetyltransferase
MTSDVTSEMTSETALETERDRHFAEYGEIERLSFGGGHLSVSINSRIPEAVGLLGDIELPPDDMAADELLKVACNWCRVRGCTDVLAGVSRNTWYPFRIVLSGFDALPPFSGEPQNVPNLATRLAARGFEPVAHYESTWGGDSTRFLAAGQPKIEAAQAAGYMIRPFDPAHAPRDLAFVHGVILKAFEPPANYLFHPISLEEFLAVLGPATGRLDPGLFLLATARDGSPAGFIYSTPEGDDIASIKTLAVVPEHRSTGLGGALGALTHRACIERGRPRIIHALMRTANHSRAIDVTAGYEVLRRYAVFGHSLSAS